MSDDNIRRLCERMDALRASADQDPKIEREQVERVRALRAKRDGWAVESALRAVRDAAGGTTNLVPLVLAAAKASATVGEIAGVLRDVWGEHVETVVL